MTPPTERRPVRWLMVLPLAAAFCIAPSNVKFDHSTASLSIETASALAKDGSGGSGSDGGGGHSGSDSHDGNSGSNDDGKGGRGSGGDEGAANQNGARGRTIETQGGRIVIRYPDGYMEEISHGILRLKDPDGRTVVERLVTASDRARLKALGHP